MGEAGSAYDPHDHVNRLEYIVRRNPIIDAALGTAIFRQVQASCADQPGVFVNIEGRTAPSIDLGVLEPELITRIWKMVSTREKNLHE